MKSSNLIQKFKGSYYIRVRKSGWYLWFKHYDDGNAKREAVDVKATRDFGFKSEWSIDQAKAHCSQLNKERSFQRDKIRISAKRVTELKSIDETLFPIDRVKQFEELLEDENFGSEFHLKKLNSHFMFVQKLCNNLRIQPQEYKENQKKIYKYFIKQKISVNYAKRIITLINRWGKFVSKSNGSFYEDVSSPKGRELSAIADSQKTKRGKDTELGVRTESQPLTPDKLNSVKDKLKAEQFNWLFLSIWLGLRPEEVDCLLDEKRFRLEYNIKKKINVLHIYQSKLQSVSEDRRWKAIPILFPQQQQCLEIIGSSIFKKPIYKIVRKYIGEGISLYGGRKGFVDLMLSLGQTIENGSVLNKCC